jgi:LacI family transcriptional regulator
MQYVDHVMEAIRMLRDEPNFADQPIVSLVEPVPGTSSVHPDNEAAGYLAMSHLLKMGHRHVLSYFYESTDYPAVATRRYKGIVRAIADHGLSLSDVTILPGPKWYGVDSMEARDAEFVELIKSHPEVTAIIAQNDKNATELHTVLQKGGIQVPDDISMISFDETDPIIVGSENILTTVKLPLMECGEVGTELLIRQIMGKEPEEQEIILPVRLIERGSVIPVK